MKPRVVVLAYDPARRARALLLGLLWLVTLVLAVAALVSMVPRLALAASTGAATERYRLAGDHITVYDLAGAVTVGTGTGPDVVVEVTRHGPDAGALKVATGPIGSRSTLRVIFPSGHIVYRDFHGELRRLPVRSDGTFGGRKDGLHLFRYNSISDHGRGTEAWADVRILVPKGRDLEVRLGAGTVDASGVDGTLTLDTQVGPVRAAAVRGSLVVDTGSGRVDVRDVAGDLTVDTGSGAVVLEGVEGARVSVETGSGAVTGRDVRAGQLLVDTGSGHVALEEVRAPRVKVDTGSGGVTLGLLDDVDDVLVDTGSGGVTLRVPATLGAALQVDTGSGGIDSEVPLSRVRKDHGEMQGILGDGIGRILIDTGSGGVRLVKL